MDGIVSDPPPANPPPANEFVLYLRECLLLLAIQVVTVTYLAGLNPPGGVWPETKDGHLTGNPILSLTYHVRYNAFSYSNTTALMASAAVVLLLLLVRGESSKRPWFNNVLRGVVCLGTLALAVAYAAGASRNKFTTIFSSALIALLFLCVVIFTAIWIHSAEQGFSGHLPPILSRYMLSAIFVASVAYTAGLSPPGGFWLDTQEGHRAGDPALPFHNRRRFTAFFVGNTMAFVGSLFIIPAVLTGGIKMERWYHLWGFIAPSGLVIAYAAGSNVNKAYIAYVLLSGSAIMPGMGLILVFECYIWPSIWKPIQEWLQRKIGGGPAPPSSKDGIDPFFVLMFTTLSSAVTYQAGLNPPGGLWLDDLDGHKAGDPILLAMHPARYKWFIYFNSMALVASLVAMVMALTESQRSRALDGLMVLDLIGLIGAYAAGSCLDVQTSIHVISIGGAIVVYVVFHMAFLMPHDNLESLIKETKEVELDRDLMLGILGATLTYQTGLTPPGGFWPRDDEFGHHAGEPVLLSTYPTPYTVFFYLNATCFMSSIFLTILFVNPFLYRAGIRCRALFICVLAVLLGLIGAYAAGSYRNLKPSIYIIIMLGALAFIFIISILCLHQKFRVRAPSSGSPQSGQQDGQQGSGSQQSGQQDGQQGRPGEQEVLRYMVLIGSIGATVTYQVGLAPPCGFWPDDSNGNAVGNPVLRDMDAYRYHMFFFFNTTSFSASWLIYSTLPQLLLQLFPSLPKEWIQSIYNIIQAATVVYAIGILGAYAAGSSSGWNNTSYYAMALVAPLLFCIFLLDPVVTLVRKMADAMVFN